MSSLTLKTTEHERLHKRTLELLAKFAEAWDPAQGREASVLNDDLQEASKLYDELSMFEVT